MRLLKNSMFFFAALLSLASEAQTKNIKTETVKVYGNCEKCKKNIETAAAKKGIARAVWNADSKLLTLTYDSTKTTSDDLLKRIAYTGYDNEKFIAPDDAYNRLDECCQYDRMKPQPKATVTSGKTDIVTKDTVEKNKDASTISTNPLADVYAAYFALKDALTKDDGITASLKAKEMFKALDKVDMNKMDPNQHATWMKYQEKILYDVEHIKGVTETEHQREHFVSLSKNMYEVMKVFKMDVPVYYEFCPMANEGKGATWLSLEPKIANPYMGKQMPACGKVQETIK